LEELRDSFLKRDILESSVKNELDFYQLFTLLAEQVSGLVNTNELAGTLKIRNEIVKEYLIIMQKCFHVELIRPFHSNLRKELVKMPKAYFNDLGMRNILLEDLTPLSQRADKGSLLENYTFLRLRDRYRSKLNYWRTADGNEIDFIITRGGRPVQAYEVKFSGSKFNRERFRKFTDTYQGVELECISFDGEGDSFPVIRV
jgi:predicted AAA+ superfamily ATPase